MEPLRDIERRLSAATKMRLSEDKSRDGVIADSKKALWNGYVVSFKRPKDYLSIFKNIARMVSRLPEFSRSSFKWQDVFLVKDTREKGRHLIVPIPTDEKLKIKRLREYIRKKPWVYTLGKKKGRIKEPAWKSFKKYLKDNIKRGKLIAVKTEQHIYQLKIIKFNPAKKSKEMKKVNKRTLQEAPK